MTGLDTNVLVRLIVDDDPEQADRAEAVIRRTYESGSVCYVNKVVLCELVWTLAQTYRCEKSEIVDALDSMLCGPQFTFEDEFQVERAFTAFQKGAGDFADHLIGATNRAAGCERTVTFDRKAARFDDFEAL